jgi:hypothetical protein
MARANRGHAISWSWWTTKKFERETEPWSLSLSSRVLGLARTLGQHLSCRRGARTDEVRARTFDVRVHVSRGLD